MTNKEFLIAELHKHCGDVDLKTVEHIFQIINKRDWADFCSQMGDYDHPEERVFAEKEMNDKLEELAGNSYALQDAVAYVLRALKMDIYPTSSFYHRNFHKMNEEYDVEVARKK